MAVLGRVYIPSRDWMGLSAAKTLDSMSADPSWWRIVVPAEQYDSYASVWPGQVLSGGKAKTRGALAAAAVRLSAQEGELRRWVLDDRCTAFALTDRKALKKEAVSDWADLWPLMDEIAEYAYENGLYDAGLTEVGSGSGPAMYRRFDPNPRGCHNVGDVEWPSCAGDEACVLAQATGPVVGFRNLSVRLGKRPVGEPKDTPSARLSNALCRDPSRSGRPVTIKA